MTNMDAPARPDRTERRSRRRPIMAFALAVLATGGIGAALTSAAWTDNTFFSAPAAGATFNLQGSTDGTTWKESAAKNSIELVVPAEKLANLLPGETRTIKLWVKNASSVNAALTSTVEYAPGNTATDFTVKPTATITGLAASLTSSGSTATDEFDLVVTTPADWPTSNQGKTGTILVTVSATATN
ncbi:hypothetical protein O5Y58_15755 [Microbacterium paraoxydans]|uniref:hypothetical protein n=1 Tax=Microbacterium paraoxydans TaxID=199592 RepID=UPI00352ECB0D